MHETVLSIGIDPGSDYLGLSTVMMNETSMTSPALYRLRMGGLDLGVAANKVVEIIEASALGHNGPILLNYEIPPPTARKDANHGFQAPIGWKLGIITGAIISPFLLRDEIVVKGIDVTDWRQQLFVFAAQWGPGLSRPSRKQIVASNPTTSSTFLQSPLKTLKDKTWEGTYSCGHKLAFKNLAAVQSAPKNCPVCCPDNEGKRDVAVEIRAAWKSLSCRFTKHHFPEAYGNLVNEAKLRARSQKMDHELNGVSDACDAMCICVAAASQFLQKNPKAA